MAIVISKLSFNVFPIVKFIQLIDIRTTQKLVASNLGFYFHAYIQCFIHTRNWFSCLCESVLSFRTKTVSKSTSLTGKYLLDTSSINN